MNVIISIYVVGSSGVGKSTVVNIFTAQPEGSILSTLPHTIENVTFYETEVMPLLSLEEENTLRRVNGFVFVYDISNFESFEAVKKMRDTIIQARNCIYYTPQVLIGHKSDRAMERQVSSQAGLMTANSWKTTFFETTYIGVQNIYAAIFGVIKDIYDMSDIVIIDNPPGTYEDSEEISDSDTDDSENNSDGDSNNCFTFSLL